MNFVIRLVRRLTLALALVQNLSKTEHLSGASHRRNLAVLSERCGTSRHSADLIYFDCFSIQHFPALAHALDSRNPSITQQSRRCGLGADWILRTHITPLVKLSGA